MHPNRAFAWTIASVVAPVADLGPDRYVAADQAPADRRGAIAGLRAAGRADMADLVAEAGGEPA